MNQDNPLPSPEALRTNNAHRFDPVRFAYIESLQRRSENQSEAVRRILQEKKHRALQAYLADLEQASAVADTQLQDIRTHFPERLEQAQALRNDFSFRQLGYLVRQLQKNTASCPVQGLTDALSGQRDAQAGTPELESTRQFRDSLARRKANRLVHKAALEAPAEPGPLNPQMLALRSLEVMRELSPAYLHRFVNYIDTLLWLQQAGDKNS